MCLILIQFYTFTLVTLGQIGFVSQSMNPFFSMGSFLLHMRYLGSRHHPRICHYLRYLSSCWLDFTLLFNLIES